MTPLAALYALAAGLLATLGLRSLVVLRGTSPWTSGGWIASTLYCAIVVVRFVAHAPALPLHGEYVILGIMALAFVVAGVRREPQAEPWWWPASTR